MYGAILDKPLHDAPAQPGNDATETERAADAEVRMGSNVVTPAASHVGHKTFVEGCPVCAAIQRREAVHHPAHYGGDTVYEAIKVIEAWQLGFHLGNVLKYIRRAQHKDNLIQNLQKARWYLDRYIESLTKADERTSDPNPHPASIQTTIGETVIEELQKKR